MKSSVCYKYVRVAFLPIVNTSTQPEVLRQIGIRFIICVVAMWLQALDKTLSMRRDKLSAWHFPNYLHRYGATLHDEVTLPIMTYNFATSIPLFFPKLHLNGWSECATNLSNFFPLHTIKMSRMSGFVVSLVFRFICRDDARCRDRDVMPQRLVCFTDISFLTIVLPRMIRLTWHRNLIEINALWNRVGPWTVLFLLLRPMACLA